MYDRVRLPIRHWLRGSKIRRSGLRVYNPPPSRRSKRAEHSFDAQLDQILTKIHEQGQDSLTDQEREFLDQASRRYRSPED
jgi:hypothetical protein